MAFSHGSKTKVYVNGYDLSAYFKSAKYQAKVDTAETTTFGAAAKTYIPGLPDATVSLEGIYDGSPNAVDQVLQAALGKPGVMVLLPQGDGNGSVGYGLSNIETSVEIDSPVDDVTGISAEVQSTSGMERITTLHPLQAEAAAGNGTGIDQTAATSNGGAGYLEMVSGSSVTVKIQHSNDNGSTDPWADVVAFTAASGGSAQRVAVTGTIKRYVRVTWSGAATFYVGLARF
ncbi:MAG: hypothetical protein IMW98_08395 [Firmicutes bacterium]|nr:hypothetical protein [Bacillota bacterium]MBE3590825.1 hypothetical protein [Bacillota bacterium]